MISLMIFPFKWRSFSSILLPTKDLLLSKQGKTPLSYVTCKAATGGGRKGGREGGKGGDVSKEGVMFMIKHEQQQHQQQQQ
jgi:hypothetical protein